MKPAGDFDLETLKDEEGDKQGRQLRQGRNKGRFYGIVWRFLLRLNFYTSDIHMIFA